MKKALPLVFLMVLAGVWCRSQTVDITDNAATSQNIGLGFSNYHVAEYIYTQAEVGTTNFLTAATAIRHINIYAVGPQTSPNVSFLGLPNNFGGVKIYLKNVPAATTTFTAGTYDISGYTLVYTGNFTVPYEGFVGVYLNTPFVRTTGMNLQMMIERTDNVDHNFSGGVFTWLTSNGNNISSTLTTSRRYNGTAALSASTSLAASAFRLGVEFDGMLNVDATLSSLSNATSSCNSTNNFSAVIKNVGFTTIPVGAATVSFRTGGANTATFTKTNTTALPYGATETIPFNAVNVSNTGVTIDSAFVTFAGDLDRSNDTLENGFVTMASRNVSNGNPAVTGAEPAAPLIFSTADIVVGYDQYWDIYSAPPRYKNSGLSDSLGAHSGTSFYWFDSYNADPNTVSRLVSDCITLPATTSGCTSGVTFWLSHDTSYATSRDSVYLTISTNKGVTWTRLAGYGRYRATALVPAWAQESFNLTAYQGMTYQLGFEAVGKYGNIIGLDDINISTNCTLPITLGSFKGERKGTFNALTWTTVLEANNSGFELQRSPDGTNFTALGFIASKAVSGNSNSTLSYNFDDIKPLVSTGYYRLKQIDKDGRSTLSNVVLIKGIPVSQLVVGGIYPNPVNDYIKFVVTSGVAEVISINIVDLTGKTISSRTQQAVTGDNVVNINTSGIGKGSYMLKVTDSKGQTSTQKFVKL